MVIAEANNEFLIKKTMEPDGFKTDHRPHIMLMEVLRAAGIVISLNGAYKFNSQRFQGTAGMLSSFDTWLPLHDWLGGRSHMESIDDGRRGGTGTVYATRAATIGKIQSRAASVLALELLGDEWIGPGRTIRILDIGCGSAVWSKAIHKLEIDTELVLLDLPEVIKANRDDFGDTYDEKVTWISGNYRQVMYQNLMSGTDKGFDIVLVANVLHLEATDIQAVLIKRWKTWLADGGIMIVIDVFGGDPMAVALYDLHLAMRSEHGRRPDYRDVAQAFGEPNPTEGPIAADYKLGDSDVLHALVLKK